MQSAIDEIADGFHDVFFQATGGDGGSTEAQAASDLWRAGVIQNGILIRDDAGGFQCFLGLGAGEIGVAGAKIDQHQVIVGATGLEAIPFLLKRGRQGAGIFHDLLRIRLEFRPQRFAESNRLGGDDVHERPALAAGEYRAINRFGKVLVVGEDQTAARTAQCLVSGCGDEVRMRKRRGMHAGDAQPGDVGHVSEEQSAYFIGNRTELGKIDRARIGAVATEDHLRLDLTGFGANGIEIDSFGLGIQLVVIGLVEDGRGIELHPVRKVPA